MKVSLIVAVYKDIEALRLIVKALENQTYLNFELVVAEDNDSLEMKNFIKSVKTISIEHTYQEDRGVRKSRSVNNAILKATGEYLIFIDGDCIPYSTFIESHVELSEKNKILSGRRLNLGPLFSRKIRKNIFSSYELETSFISKFFTLNKDAQEGHTEAGLYINPKTILYQKFIANKKNTSLLGCNYSCFKSDMFLINGLDESYGSSPVSDDTDIEWRFKKAGFKLKTCKFAANIFHLYHERGNKKSRIFEIGSELEIMYQRKKKDNFRALIGLDSHH
jgi:glycosyltransferase involved in cell wall biosynthesis